MVVVAVAGGTGAVGRNFVEALISQGRHEVVILSRTVCYYKHHTYYELTFPKVDAAKEKEIGARFVATDYKDVPVLTQILEDNSVHIVISTLAMMSNAAGSLEQSLIQAADASKTTKRFIPSEFGFPQRAEYVLRSITFLFAMTNLLL